MRQLLLSAVGAFALLAGTAAARADNCNFGLGVGPRGGVNIQLGCSTGRGNYGNYGYGGGNYGRGAPVYAVPAQTFIVPISPSRLIDRQIIQVCDRNPGDWLGADGRCRSGRRIN